MRVMGTCVCLWAWSGTALAAFGPRAASRPAAQTVSCDELEARAKAQSGPLDRIEANLAAARCLLVHACAEPLSMELCWTSRPLTELGEVVERARRCLDRIKSDWKSLPESIGEDSRRTLEERAELLQSFATLFEAMAELDESSAESKRRLIDACVGVSMYLDDPNPGVAESAKLWQGVAYRRAGRPDRTLQLLWPAIGRLTSNRVEFFARIERCRALADREQYVASLALALKLSEHFEEWMAGVDEATTQRAADSLRWVRAIVHRRWADALRKAGEPERASTAEEAAAKLLGDTPFPPPPERWLHLNETIAGLPEWKSVASTEGTTAPADKS